MTTDAKNLNLRVLVIDDNPDIREDFCKILHAKVEAESFTEARSALFGDPPLSEALEPFELDCADQGQAGLIKVQSARSEVSPAIASRSHSLFTIS